VTRIKTIKDIPLQGKQVFVRVDFNVPMDDDGQIVDDTRISAAIPTIRYLVSQRAKVILASHLGRPKGRSVPELSLRIVAANLAKKLGQPITFIEGCVGTIPFSAAEKMQEGSILLLENLRFHPEEEADDPEFSKELGRFAQVYVNDAFGTAHRAHASTHGIVNHVAEAVAGFLMESELNYLGEKTRNPERPFVAILGGAKVSDKIKVVSTLLKKADSILIGGAMAYTFLLSKGYEVGDSLWEPDQIDVASGAIETAMDQETELLLPLDHVVSRKVNFGKELVGNKILRGSIQKGWIGVDIGPETINSYKSRIQSARTILWNGPLGIFENKKFRNGTLAIAGLIASNTNATSIVGGGDSIKALKSSGYENEITHICTGGGAALEFLEGVELPGVRVLHRID
tara:strand:- start:22697 stop:23899 length:1203 start_codon:yes stop_codon:yes gene_type:complete